MVKRCWEFYLMPIYALYDHPYYIMLHTFEAFVHMSLYITHLKIPCQSGSTFVKFSYIALGRHLAALLLYYMDSLFPLIE
jgi:hypothetical protein